MEKEEIDEVMMRIREAYTKGRQDYRRGVVLGIVSIVILWLLSIIVFVHIF